MRRIALVVSFIVCVSGTIYAQYKADFQKGVALTLSNGTKYVAAGTYATAAPTAVDFNNDGKKDLLIGIWGTGDGVKQAKINVLINTGTDAAPKFDAVTDLKDKAGNIIYGYNG